MTVVRLLTGNTLLKSLALQASTTALQGYPSMLCRTMSAGTLAWLFASLGRPKRANFDWR